MNLDEAIKHAREVAKENQFLVDDERFSYVEDYEECQKLADEHEQLAEWLEELKELRAYKGKMEMQFLDDIDNPLEPLKLSCALNSEIFKYNYRKEHKPKDISPLDITVMYALKHCLDEQTKAGGKND